MVKAYGHRAISAALPHVFVDTLPVVTMNAYIAHISVLEENTSRTKIRQVNA